MEKQKKTLSVPRSHLFSNSPDCPSYNPHDISFGEFSFGSTNNSLTDILSIFSSLFCLICIVNVRRNFVLVNYWSQSFKMLTVKIQWRYR